MHEHNIVLSRKMLLIIIVIVLSLSPSCMLVIVGMNTISDVFLNALIRARQKSSVLSLTLIVLANIEPSLVQRLVPGWLQNIYKHSLIVIVPRHTMFSYSVSHWKLPLCLISVTGRKNLLKFPCDTQNTLMSVFLKDQMLCTQCACKCFRATCSGRMKTSFRSDSNVACYATFCYLKTEYLQMTFIMM